VRVRGCELNLFSASSLCNVAWFLNLNLGSCPNFSFNFVCYIINGI
jgi:hypothetical protein